MGCATSSAKLAVEQPQDASASKAASDSGAAAVAEHAYVAPASLGKAATDGYRYTNFEHHFTEASRSACMTGAAKKKRVLMVIDVMDGYDAAFVASLADDFPGSLGYIKAKHDVKASYELQSKRLIERFSRGQRAIAYDKKWNVGIDGAAFAKVTERIVQEIKSGGYDLIVFTYDYLERANGESAPQPKRVCRFCKEVEALARASRFCVPIPRALTALPVTRCLLTRARASDHRRGEGRLPAR